jgi:isopentenyl phosphate kinase
MKPVVFLKLGGSLITDKSHPYTPNIETLRIIISEIIHASRENKGINIILGHGSGSFGHAAAQDYYDGTRDRLNTNTTKFTEIWYRASELNRIVVDLFHEQEFSVLTISPLSSVIVKNRSIKSWNLFPTTSALENGIIPILHGDLVFDQALGVTILSTEDLFIYLAKKYMPNRILLAGREEGVWMDYPERKELIPEITPKTISNIKRHLGKSDMTDVTGGMLSKVEGMVKLVQNIPQIHAHIFSGYHPSSIYNALMGKITGTHIHS